MPTKKPLSMTPVNMRARLYYEWKYHGVENDYTAWRFGGVISELYPEPPKKRLTRSKDYDYWTDDMLDVHGY